MLEDVREELKALLKERSIMIGEFTLQSGAKSNFYVDCRQTTLHARGAVLIGELMHRLIRAEQSQLETHLDSVGGLTMGADPISLAVAMRTSQAGDTDKLNAFTVRKQAKEHGRGRRIEGPFQSGHTVVIIEDVVTTGGSALQAIEAVEEEGGKVAFVACLVDRQEGGRQILEGKGYPVIAAFTKSEFVG